MKSATGITKHDAERCCAHASSEVGHALACPSAERSSPCAAPQHDDEGKLKHTPPIGAETSEVVYAKMTRRKLAAMLVSSGALASKALAQAPAAADPLQAAKDRIKAASETLAKQQVPMATEPAFQFKV
jgi:hypothetical protein